MFNFFELSDAHIEITNRCQASCPMCSRNVRGGLDNERLKTNEWSINDFKKIFNKESLLVLKHINFCGCYGDPIFNNDLIDMLDYSLSINPNLQISIHTNGGARNSDWWKALAKVLEGCKHKVTFGIDGLEDTHHLYRIGTTYNHVVKNAKTFIDAGGEAHWQFLIFDHNQHQLEEARSRCFELGFKNFIPVDTYRFVLSDTFDVYNKIGQVTHTLKRAKQSNIKEVKVEWIKNYKKVANSTTIDCEAKRIKGIYIDAHYHLYPCCYIGGSMYNSTNLNEPLPGSDNEVKEAWRNGCSDLNDQLANVVNSLGGLSAIDTTKRSIKEIIEDENYELSWKNEWNEPNKNLVCSGKCGKNVSWSSPVEQFNIK
jgi:MoaA/NifB/PqqE/SkfB family radical SAM enzyme